MTTLSVRQPPEAHKPDLAKVTSENFIRAFPIATALCEAEQGHGRTLASVAAPERVAYQWDAIAALRRRNTIARSLAVYRGAETLYTLDLQRRNLSHLADWKNLKPTQRARFLEDAAAVDTVIHGTLSGSLEGGQ